MATPTYDPIASTTLTSSALSVTFSSLDTIAAGYRDLVLVVTAKNIVGTAQGMGLILNGDTAANYSYVYMAGNGTSTYSVSGTGNSAGMTGRSWTTGSDGFMSVVQIMDFSATDKHKSILVRSNNAAVGTDAFADRWANTAAVTSATVQINSSSFAAGSTFSLYGIAA